MNTLTTTALNGATLAAAGLTLAAVHTAPKETP